MTSRVADARVSLSLRLPRRIVDEVEAYAAKHGVSKTEAFLHYTQLGIEHDKQRASLDSVSAQLDEVLSLLRGHDFDTQQRGTCGDGPLSGRSAEDGQLRAGCLAMEAGRVRDAVAEVSSSYPAVLEAYLFGSFARGDYTDDSDVDIRLVLDRREPFTLRDLARFSKRIEQLTGRDADVVTATKVKNEALAAAIEREKVLVYEREAR